MIPILLGAFLSLLLVVAEVTLTLLITVILVLLVRSIRSLFRSR